MITVTIFHSCPVLSILISICGSIYIWIMNCLCGRTAFNTTPSGSCIFIVTNIFLFGFFYIYILFFVFIILFTSNSTGNILFLCFSSQLQPQHITRIIIPAARNGPNGNVSFLPIFPFISIPAQYIPLNTIPVTRPV